MEKGKAKQLLDKMQVLIEDGQNVPLQQEKSLSIRKKCWK